MEALFVRLVDIDPFCPVGIDLQRMRILDIFLLHCLLADSPPDSPQEIAAMTRNQRRIAERGRDPNLRLHRAGLPAPCEEASAAEAAGWQS